MPDEQQGHAPYCTKIPRPGDRLTDACPDCGHATVLHLGVDHCPVCELVARNERARGTANHVEVHVQGHVLTEQQLMDAIRKGRRPH